MTEYPFRYQHGGDRSKPAIIRRVIKADRFGKPKIVRDYRAFITVERILAAKARWCAAGNGCQHNRDRFTHAIIERGDYYAALTENNKVGRYVGHPPTHNYHFECLPPKAKPMVRFFAEFAEVSARKA
jgi:hypothetical protein